MVALGVDHIGSVIPDENGWKDAALRETLRVIREAGATSSLIPLFSRTELILKAVDYYRMDILHFCESLTARNGIGDHCRHLIEIQEQVKSAFPQVRIMRSIPIGKPGRAGEIPTLKLAELFEPVSDLFLTDTLITSGPGGQTNECQQPVNGFIGITGCICDWQTARRLVEHASIPVILAGGITPDNAVEGALKVRPAGVDSCTGTNALDSAGRPIRFKKDREKVKRLVDSMRMLELESF